MLFLAGNTKKDKLVFLFSAKGRKNQIFFFTFQCCCSLLVHTFWSSQMWPFPTFCVSGKKNIWQMKDCIKCFDLILKLLSWPDFKEPSETGLVMQISGLPSGHSLEFITFSIGLFFIIVIKVIAFYISSSNTVIKCGFSCHLATAATWLQQMGLSDFLTLGIEGGG